ncbi:hypothetical protein [Nocardia sp. CWNU-33]|uniref:hypothetical protein n=1 Tax=Nocardia sp. CWNU-33 TaxID=3392117 RepID=UPI00398E5B2D
MRLVSRTVTISTTKVVSLLETLIHFDVTAPGGVPLSTLPHARADTPDIHSAAGTAGTMLRIRIE